jgi:hypothetical protein
MAHRAGAPLAALLACLLSALTPAPACAQHLHGAEDAAATPLGTVAFEISCRADVRATFNQGVSLLHSFWYEAARRRFEAVAAADPACAMADWGIAMTLYPQVNDWPQPQAAAAAERALAAAASAAEKSPREDAYLRALHRFYDGYTPASALTQARAYAAAMGAVARHYPDDLEAQVFAALALLAADPGDDVALTNAHAAYALLAPLFQTHPDHPGIAHYLIHACDHPGMAQLGLPAAERYAQIAPGAPHALHMPSHIFARLGRWPDDVRSNLASESAALHLLGAHQGGENRLHAQHFMVYAYLQMGQDAQAQAVMRRAQSVQRGDVDPRYPDFWAFVTASLPALYAIETRDWVRAARLAVVAHADAGAEAVTLLAHAMAAAHQHDVRAAHRAGQRLAVLLAADPPPPRSRLGPTLPAEIGAWVTYSEGNLARAQQLLTPVAARQAVVGKGEVELPAREMLAEMLLLDGQPGAALQAYQLSLQSDPGRLNALLGAGQAAERLGQPQVAAGFYRTLRENCPMPSGPARAALAHALAAAGS